MTSKVDLDKGASARTHHVLDGAFLADVVAGLSAKPRYLPSKYFYDDRGSQLFAQICETPEYYPTRTEVGILSASAPEIAALIGPAAHLVELGSGPSTKVRILLDAFERLETYIPVDISGDYLARTARTVAQDYNHVRVAPLCADFTHEFTLPRLPRGGRIVGFFPGSTIGNFSPEQAKALLRRFARALGSGSSLLMGVDLKKDPAILHAAYNDAAGITAAFNLNILKRINREISADFDLTSFVHRAVYNAEKGRIEMFLESTKVQAVHIAGRHFTFDAGEAINTEVSYKYGLDEFKELAAGAGYACRAVWTDANRYFGVFYLTLDN
jgi:L-histidine Nalpha-methyltransferase